MTFTEAGEVLNMRKQGVHRLIFNSENCGVDVENDVRAVGERPLMLIRASAVAAEKRRRDAAASTAKTKAAGSGVTVPRRRRQVVG